MLVTAASSPLRAAGQLIQHTGRFVDDFQRLISFQSAPLGLGWQDLGELFPQSYDITRIHNGGATSGDPFWRGENGADQLDPSLWHDYANYPGMAAGGISGAIRNVGDGIFNYDVTCRMGGVVEGVGGIEAEATPLVGVNTASVLLGFGAWLVNLGTHPSSNAFVWLVGYMGNPPEDFFVTHVGPVTHTNGQERDLTIKYRGTTATIWLDGSQITNLTTYPAGTPIGSTPITMHVDHQNQSWAGFEYDQHITPPDQILTNPSVLSYEHQVIS
jgi:hypothetical protein